MTDKPKLPEKIDIKELGYSVCLDCGKKYSTRKKTMSVIGIWTDDCTICGKEGVACAAAGHDFGIYKMPKLEVLEKKE